MKKIKIAAIILCSFVFMITSSHAEDINVNFQAVKVDLVKGGMEEKEVIQAQKQIKTLLKEGTQQKELKKVVLDLVNKGLEGSNLQKALDSMSELIKSGETPKQAGNIVSQAAHQAKAQGLKGKELAAKVHEAIKERKAEMEQLKKQKQEAEKTAKKAEKKAKKN